MSTEKAAGTEALTRYHNAYERMRRLSVMRLQGHVSDDPSHRLKFLTDIENGRVMARVELNAFSRILTEVLGVESTVVMRYFNEELEAQLSQLEEELNVVAYDEKGNPVLGEVK